ncbi:MAG: hypothetical protein HY368_02755 [Candidatus Aenigmarchaeota archaeon]|nr:hypothetical protein [Candidatus Aenigmarchaeota archaeon]
MNYKLPTVNEGTRLYLQRDFLQDPQFESKLVSKFGESQPELMGFVERYLSQLPREAQGPVLTGILLTLRLLESQGEADELKEYVSK